MRLYNKEVKYAIFNFDGTLANTACIWGDIFDYYFSKRKINIYEDKNYAEENIDFDLPTLAKYTKEKYFPDYKLEDIINEWNEMFIDEYKNHKDIRSFAIDLLETLLTYDIKIAVITKYDLDLFETFARRNNIFDYLSLVKKRDKITDICQEYDSLIEDFGAKKEEVMIVDADMENLKSIYQNGYFTIGMYNYLLSENHVAPKKYCHHFFGEPLDFSLAIREQNELEVISISNFKLQKFMDGYELLGLIDEDVDALHVPSKINDKRIYRIGREAFKDKGFEKVILEEGLLYIDVEAFDGFKKAKEIIFPSTMREISTYGFTGSEFEKIVFKGYIPNMYSAFGGMPNLKEIIFPKNFKSISFRLFWLNNALEEVKFIDGLEEIGTQAFNKCDNLKTIYLPKSVKRISDNAFYRCYKLEKVIYEGSREDREKIYIENDNDGNIKLIEAEWFYNKKY